jgi:hypothetical protein
MRACVCALKNKKKRKENNKTKTGHVRGQFWLVVNFVSVGQWIVYLKRENIHMIRKVISFVLR